MSHYPDNIFPGMVANRAAELGTKVLTIEGAGVRPDEVRTYRQLWDNGQRMAQAMLDGIAPGERVALLMANHAEFVEAMVAAGIGRSRGAHRSTHQRRQAALHAVQQPVQRSHRRRLRPAP